MGIPETTKASLGPHTTKPQVMLLKVDFLELLLYYTSFFAFQRLKNHECNDTSAEHYSLRNWRCFQSLEWSILLPQQHQNHSHHQKKNKHNSTKEVWSSTRLYQHLLDRWLASTNLAPKIGCWETAWSLGNVFVNCDICYTFGIFHTEKWYIVFASHDISIRWLLLLL